VLFDQASCVIKIEQAMRVALGDYERGLVESDKVPDTVHTYVDGAERFIKYLVGTYVPWLWHGRIWPVGPLDLEVSHATAWNSIFSPRARVTL
jgi:hypothetical protein